MSFSKVSLDITQHKPRMKTAKYTKDISIPWTSLVTAQVKADGEFNLIKYSREAETYMVNRFGRKTTNLACLTELVEALKQWNMVEAEILAELYTVGEQGEPRPLPILVHNLKGSDKSLQKRLRIGLFDIVSINGKPNNLLHNLKLDMMSEWVKEAATVQVLPYIEAHTDKELDKFWSSQVEGNKWEGLVIRFNSETWKVKPNNYIDAAIIGINKSSKGFADNRATSLKLGLMNDEGCLVEIGDCSGIGEAESKELWQLMDLKAGEDSHTVYVQPVVVAEIEHIDVFPDTKNKVYSLVDGKMKEVSETTLVRLKSPHIHRYRPDKKACPEDIGLNQVS